MPVDLLFRQAPRTNPAELLFGEVESLPDVTFTLSATLPEPTFSARFPRFAEFTFSATLPEPTFSATFPRFASFTLAATLADPPFSARVATDVAVDRPTVGHASNSWQSASAQPFGVAEPYQRGERLASGSQSAWARAASFSTGAVARFSETDRLRSGARAVHQEAVPAIRESLLARHEEMLRTRREGLTGAYQAAQRLGAVQALGPWQERLRQPRPDTTGRYTTALRRGTGRTFRHQTANALARGWAARYQEAMRPPPGRSLEAPPPLPPPPCYAPVLPALLVFSAPLSGDGQLLFVCDPVTPTPAATIVVPVRRVYMTVNTLYLRRVVGNLEIPVFSMRLAIDAESWTWTWGATVHGDSLSLLDAGSGPPVEVEARINGATYRLLVERMARDRQFPTSRLQVSGRGRNAVLAAPYADVKAFGNTIDRTAQQLMADALTDNNVAIGWDVAFGLDDWLVPAGSWAHQGTYLTAVQTIAAAAAGYVQPHRTANTLRVLPRYPVAPWDWAGVTPDFEIPSSAVVREAIEWVEKPHYNRVYVSGSRSGILAQVTRAGTAGDVLAPMVTDDLIVATAAARQRGTAVLADTGRQAPVSISLPVLSETGVIEPGAFVRYLDGSTSRMGLVRSLSLESSGAVPRQTLGVETHVT